MGQDEGERGLRQLTWRDWRAVLGRAALDMGDDAAPLLSAGVAFYMFLSVFPGLLAALTVYGLLADPVQVEAQITSVLAALPAMPAVSSRSACTPWPPRKTPRCRRTWRRPSWVRCGRRRSASPDS